MVEAERRADRDHPLARLERARIAGAQCRQSLGVDLQQCDVGLLVAADDLGGELAAIGQLHPDLVGTVDDVVVGQHVTVGGDDETGAGGYAAAPARLLRHSGHAGHARAEEAAEEFRHLVVIRHLVLLRHARADHGFDIDDGRADLVDQLREIRQADDQRRGCCSGRLRGGDGEDHGAGGRGGDGDQGEGAKRSFHRGVFLDKTVAWRGMSFARTAGHVRKGQAIALTAVAEQARRCCLAGRWRCHRPERPGVARTGRRSRRHCHSRP
jgi:hypothetical protein